MNKHLLLAVIVSVLTTGWGMLESKAAEKAAAVLSLDQVNARISALEGELMASLAEREQARHELEYGNEEMSLTRAKAKKLEKQIIDLKLQYDERLRIADKGYRDLEAEIGRKHDAMNDLKQLGEAIQREVSLAGVATNGLAGGVQELQAEGALNQEQIEQIRSEIGVLNKELAARKKLLNESDADLARMSVEIRELEEVHRKVLAELGQSTDQSDKLKALDARRQEIMTELREWRSVRDRLEKSKPAAE